MAIREAGTGKLVPGYENTPRRTIGKPTPPKATKEVEAKKVASKVAPKAAPKAEPKKKQSNTPKATFKTTIMALNSDDQYVKKSQEELEDDKQLIQTFTRWVNSGQKGEFFAIRRR